MAFRSLCHESNIEPFARVFLSLYGLLHQKDDDFYYLSSKSGNGLFVGLPSFIKHWKERFFMLSHPDPSRWDQCLRVGQFTCRSFEVFFK